MAYIDKTYHSLLKEITEKGYLYDDPNRKGVRRLEIPSYTFRHEFQDGFPAITTKELNYKNVVTELLWFLKGDTNIKYLVDNGCNIWNKDAYRYFLKKFENVNLVKLPFATFIGIIKTKEKVRHSGDYFLGDLGSIYSQQWRAANGVQLEDNEEGGYEATPTYTDQVSNLIKGLKNNPLATDHIVNSWNVGELKNMALKPCHYGFQIVVRPLNLNERREIYGKLATFSHKELDDKNIPEYGFELHWSQRSCDTFLGIPYNIASYATLALMLEKLTGYKALAIQGDLKKVHLYDNQIAAAKEQLRRDIERYKECQLEILSRPEYHRISTYGLETCSFDNYMSNVEIHDFKLKDYESYEVIKVPMLSYSK